MREKLNGRVMSDFFVPVSKLKKSIAVSVFFLGVPHSETHPPSPVVGPQAQSGIAMLAPEARMPVQSSLDLYSQILDQRIADNGSCSRGGGCGLGLIAF